MWDFNSLYCIFITYVSASSIAAIIVKPSPNIGSYFKVCHRSDPKLNECMKDGLENLKPYLKTGIPELSIPSFEPLVIPEITMNQGRGALNLQTTFTDLHLWKLSEFYIKDFRANLDSDEFSMKLWFPSLASKSRYQISGRILLLPIEGNGICEGNYSSVDESLRVRGSRLREGNFTYFRVDSVDINLDIGGIGVHFENLFNGDQELGDAMNLFLNDNWRYVMKDMKPVLETSISQVVKDLFNAIYNKFPLEVILPL